MKHPSPLRDKLTGKWLSVAIMVLGAIAAILSSPKLGIAIFAWIWPVTVLFFWREAQIKRKWLWFLPVFILANAISTNGTVPFPLPVLLVISALSALIQGLIFQLDRWLTLKNGHFLTTLFFPAACTTREFIDANGGGGIWGSLANSQYSFHWITQLASVTGLFGISFLVYWMSSVIIWAFSRVRNGETFKMGLTIYSAVFFFILLFGAIRFNVENSSNNKIVSVAGVSVPSFDFIESVYFDYSGKRQSVDPRTSLTSPAFQEMKKAYIPLIETADTIRFRTGYAAMKKINDSLFSLSAKAASRGARIISWSEANALLFPFDEKALLERGKEFVKSKKVYLLMAMAVIHPGKIDDGRKWLENKAVLLGPDGDIKNVLHKNKPVPLAEASEPGDGKIPLIKTEYGNLSTSICYDADFPVLMQQLGKQGTDVLLLPSGDWFDIDPIHTQMAVFRGIENGCSIFRQVSGGLSLATDYRGKSYGSMDFYSEGEKLWLTHLPIHHVSTIYSRVGDVFAYGCIVITLIGLGFIIAGARLKRKVRILNEAVAY